MCLVESKCDHFLCCKPSTLDPHAAHICLPNAWPEFGLQTGHSAYQAGSEVDAHTVGNRQTSASDASRALWISAS